MIHEEICIYEVCKLARERYKLLTVIEHLKKTRAELEEDTKKQMAYLEE